MHLICVGCPLFQHHQHQHEQAKQGAYLAAPNLSLLSLQHLLLNKREHQLQEAFLILILVSSVVETFTLDEHSCYNYII